MVLFGLGLAVGNWIGGRFTDRSLFGTLFVTSASVLLMATFGFATVSPIQKLMMNRASQAGAPTMAASVNIGMFMHGWRNDCRRVRLGLSKLGERRL